MDIVAAKILIIFGLLILTLAAALLPLFCLMLTTRHKRRSRHRQVDNIANESLCHKLCFCGQFSGDPASHECKPTLENGNVPMSSSEIRRTKSRKKMLVSVLNCMAGGIFLGTSFTGLLPEIRECFEEFNISWPDVGNSPVASANSTMVQTEPENMPIAEIIVVLGLFFILCVEQAAHSWNHWRLKRKNPNHGTAHAKKTVLRLASNKDDHSVEETGSTIPVPPSPTFSEASVEKPSHNHSGIRSLMLVATLSTHSLLEGIAIGLQNALGSVLAIFIAVLFHKSLMGFSMGSNLVHSKQSTKKQIVAACIFALASPIGIAIGLIIHTQQEEQSDVTKLVNAILQAIATGTFLYVTFFEVLVKEFEAHGNRLAKVLSLFAGYGAVLITFVFAQH